MTEGVGVSVGVGVYVAFSQKVNTTRNFCVVLSCHFALLYSSNCISVVDPCNIRSGGARQESIGYLSFDFGWGNAAKTKHVPKNHKRKEPEDDGAEEEEEFAGSNDRPDWCCPSPPVATLPHSCSLLLFGFLSLFSVSPSGSRFSGVLPSPLRHIGGVNGVAL